MSDRPRGALLVAAALLVALGAGAAWWWRHATTNDVASTATAGDAGTPVVAEGTPAGAPMSAPARARRLADRPLPPLDQPLALIHDELRGLSPGRRVRTLRRRARTADGRTIDNVGVVRMLGIPIGRLQETITRGAPGS